MFILLANIFNHTHSQKRRGPRFSRNRHIHWQLTAKYVFAMIQIFVCNISNICLQYLMDKSQVCVTMSFRWKRGVFEKQLMKFVSASSDLSKVQNVFALIEKYICPNCNWYLSKFQNV